MIDTSSIDVETLEGRLLQADVQSVVQLYPAPERGELYRRKIAEATRQFARSDEHIQLVARQLGSIIGYVHVEHPTVAPPTRRNAYIRETLFDRGIDDSDRRFVHSRLLGMLTVAADETNSTLLADLEFPSSYKTSLYRVQGFERVSGRTHYMVRHPRKIPHE